MSKRGASDELKHSLKKKKTSSWKLAEGGLWQHSELGIIFDSELNVYFKEDDSGNVQEYVPTKDERCEADPTLSQVNEVEGGVVIERQQQLGLTFASATNIGPKPENEDRFIENVFLGELGHMFACLDGHGGSRCVDYIKKCLPSTLTGRVSKSNSQLFSHDQNALQQLQSELNIQRNLRAQIEPGNEANDNLIVQISELIQMLEEQYELACQLPEESQIQIMKFIKDAFVRTDKNYLGMCKKRDLSWRQSGSTAVAVFIVGDHPDNCHIVCANLGDSRAILCRQGKSYPLSIDHKPNRPDEKARIEKEGGTVSLMGQTYRVHQKSVARQTDTVWLAVSRSFGDCNLKTPALVSHIPEISFTKICKDDSIIVLACDGVWDVMTNDDVLSLALSHYGDPDQAAESIIKKALDKGSQDNVTATVIELDWNRDKTLKFLEEQKASANNDEVAEEDDVDDMFA